MNRNMRSNFLYDIINRTRRRTQATRNFLHPQTYTQLSWYRARFLRHE